MPNCIFSGHCIENACDGSCPIYAETSYLLERNGIGFNSGVFNKDAKYIYKTQESLKKSQGSYKVILSGNTTKTAEFVTYCAICNNWKGSRLNCDVYNLKFSKFIDEIKKSWSARKEPESLEYMRIWSESAKVLVISNMDFVGFNDFECQTLLGLLQSREKPELSTILVSPELPALVGKGAFFDRLISTLSKAVIK